MLPESVTRRLPILLYHSVAPGGPAGQARFRISPDLFEEQLLFLRDAGYYTPRLADWRRAVTARRPLPGKAVLLTFDDGYADFAEFAWPLLRKYGFQALVFLVADAIGKTSGWNAAEDALPLLGWEQIRALQAEGVELGSHSASHPALTGLTPVEIVREAARSRALLTEGLGRPVEAFAYPHGDLDPTVAHLVGACGYLYGLTSLPGSAKSDDPLLALPRIEVAGGDDFACFVRNVTGQG
jgi:peptidoglycan/xylan/chitin deacetylase (PgdA/CDA1 family)